MSATLTVVCPQCQLQIRASSEHLGRKGRCPRCKSLVEIRAPEGEAFRSMQPTGEGIGRSRQRASDATEVKGWVGALIGGGVTAGLYFSLFLPLRKTYLGTLFVDSGFVSVATVFLSCWGFAILALKCRAMLKQQAYTQQELELIPLEISMQVTPDNVDQFLNHLGSRPAAEQSSILARRIHGALEHFKYRNSVPEVQGYLSSQAEIDASGVDGGYSLLRSIIWAVPILGFIGTVQGISSAVSHLKKVMPAATAVEKPGDVKEAKPAAKEDSVSSKLMGAMGGITSGLATAFDTTLVALSFAIFLLFLTEWLRKTEYATLDRIEQFTNEALLRRMQEKEGAGKDIGEAPGLVRDALEAAFQEHQRWLAQWQAQVAELGRVIGTDFDAAIVGVENKLGQQEHARMDRIQQAAQAVEELFGKMSHNSASWQNSATQAASNMSASFSAAEKLQHALSENTRLLSDVLSQQRQLSQDYRTGDVVGALQALREEFHRSPGVPSPAFPQQPGFQPQFAASPPQQQGIVATLPEIAPANNSRGIFGRMLGRR